MKRLLPTLVLFVSAPFAGAGQGDSLVAWSGWSAAVLEKAEAANKPVFVHLADSADSLSRSMEAESFRSPAIAELLNTRFVPVKVDRRRFPALADYLSLVAAVSFDQRRYPLNVVLAPDGATLRAAGYLPVADGWGSQGFESFLRAVGVAWEEGSLRANAVGGEAIESWTRPAEAGPGQLLSSLHEAISSRLGLGEGEEPMLDLPARELAYLATRDPQRAAALLETWARSPVFDPVGGGFFKGYLTEDRAMPVFRKDLADQVLMMEALSSLPERSPFLEDVLAQTAECVLRDFGFRSGATVSAWDSITESQLGDEFPAEGRYYLLPKAPVRAILVPEASAVISEQYGLKEEGNIAEEADFYGHYSGLNLFAQQFTNEAISEKFGLQPGSLRQIQSRAFSQLRLYRESLGQTPLKDPTVPAALEAMTVAALVQAGQSLASESVQASARAAHSRGVETALASEDPQATALAGLAALRLYRQAGDAASLGQVEEASRSLEAALRGTVLVKSVEGIPFAVPAIVENELPSATSVAPLLWRFLVEEGQEQWRSPLAVLTASAPQAWQSDPALFPFGIAWRAGEQ